MVNLELYKVFYVVAKYKSITKAAEELYISQPAVSHAIKQLETELGGKLFNRVSRGMELTETGGRQMFETVSKVMAMLGDAEKNFSNMKTLATGQVNIAAADNVINCFLLDDVKKFKDLYPDVSLKFFNGTSKECAQLVKSGKADVGLVNLPLVEDETVETYGVTNKIHDVFVANEKFSYLLDKEINLSVLADYPLLFLDSTTMTRKSIDKFADELGIKLVPDVELGSVELVVDMALEGMGIACVPKEYVLDKLASGKLKMLNVYPQFPVREIGVICAKDRIRSYAANEFLKMITD